MEPKLIETKEQLIENLNTVESYLCTDIDGDVFKEMAGYISRGRSFVAYKVNNSWHFAPSRFIGYISNSLVSHDTSKVDGTETNMALQAIFESRYFPDEKLEEAYFDYCNWLEVIPYNWPTRNFWVLDDFLSEAIELNCEEEGGLVLRKHLKKERNRKVVDLAKKKFKDEHGGRLFCEVCDFDFGRVYGKKGEGFIEAHHITPLKDIDGVHEVTTDDLAMVCSNCHSMLHRTGKSIKGLKKLIAR